MKTYPRVYFLCQHDVYFAPTIYSLLHTCYLYLDFYSLHLLRCSLNAILNSFQCHLLISESTLMTYRLVFLFATFILNQTHSGEFIISNIVTNSNPPRLVLLFIKIDNIFQDRVKQTHFFRKRKSTCLKVFFSRCKKIALLLSLLISLLFCCVLWFPLLLSHYMIVSTYPICVF